MDQKELDDAYDQAVYAPNSEQVALRRTVNSAAVRARLGFKRVAYGSTPDRDARHLRHQGPRTRP